MDNRFRLYEIGAALEAAIDNAIEHVNIDTGELEGKWSDYLESLQIERDNLILLLADASKNYDAEAEAIRAEEKRLAERRKSLEKRSLNMFKCIKSYVQEGEVLSNAHTKVSWRKSSSVKILDPKSLPGFCLKTVQEPILKEIKEAIASGEIDSNVAIIETHQNLQVA